MVASGWDGCSWRHVARLRWDDLDLLLTGWDGGDWDPRLDDHCDDWP